MIITHIKHKNNLGLKIIPTARRHHGVILLNLLSHNKSRMINGEDPGRNSFNQCKDLGNLEGFM